MLGIMVPGLYFCGSITHFTAFVGVLTNEPAMYGRAAKSMSGGPARPESAPAMAWHAVQPYWPTSRRPASGLALLSRAKPSSSSEPQLAGSRPDPLQRPHSDNRPAKAG